MTTAFPKQAQIPDQAPKPPPEQSALLESPPVESAAAEPNPDNAQQETAFKKLRRAVGKEVSSKSDEIAVSLVQHTIDGNSNTARIVVGLVDKRRRSKAEMNKLKQAALDPRRTRSVAVDLASDQQWKDEDIDHSVGDPAASDQKRREADETQTH